MTKTNTNDIVGAVALVAFAVLEGYVMTLSGIASPHFFRTQMTFTCFAILKFFLGCVGSSLIFQSIMRTLYPNVFDSTRIYTTYAFPYWRSSIGCFILGIGMYIAGTGPTMIMAQNAMGIKVAPYMLLGALIGGVVFGIVERPLGLKDSPRGDMRKTSLDGYFGCQYQTIAMPMGIGLLAVAMALEQSFPHASDAADYGVSSLNLSPVLPSLLVGLNQIPLRFIRKTGQGGSTAVMNLVATLSAGRISPQYQLKGIKSAHQLLFVYVGMGLGTWMCCTYTPEYSFASSAPDGYSSTASLVGAFLVVFGARFASGCTCGHGVTGTSELSLSSMLGAMCIFAGGIVAGIVHSKFSD